MWKLFIWTIINIFEFRITFITFEHIRISECPSSSVRSCQGEVVTCEPGDGPPWTDWGDLTEAETQHWAEDGDLSPAQARPGPPGSEARLSPEPVARVRRAPMWAWATPWHQLLHPAHGNTDTYRPLIGQTQPSLASDWLMRTTPGPLVPSINVPCVTWVSPVCLSRWHMCHGHRRLAVTFCDGHVTLRSVTSHPAASVTTTLTPDGDHYKLSRLRGSVIISRGHQAHRAVQATHFSIRPDILSAKYNTIPIRCRNKHQQ